jgi:ribosomal protein S18 acetylase RimI-like enzyme
MMTNMERQERIRDIVDLRKENIDEIIDLEKRSWIPELQASRETILRRLQNGHIFLGVRVAGTLIGKICFAPAQFDPSDRSSFPNTFDEYSNQGRHERPNAVFAYNIDVDPAYRGQGHATALLNAMVERSRNDGYVYLVGSGRPSSYEGSSSSGHEYVAKETRLKDAIDRYLAGDPFPTDEEFCLDKTLALYKSTMNCRFLWVTREFLAADKPSGGLSVIFDVDLQNNGYGKT